MDSSRADPGRRTPDVEGAADLPIVMLNADEIGERFLDRFDRRQRTTRVLRHQDGGLREALDEFIDDWDAAARAEVAAALRRCVSNGGAVPAVMRDEHALAFAAVEAERFGGPEAEYVELSYLHVSRELRGRGLGRRLLLLCIEAAKARGASHLYISAHPAVETQAFYRSCGARLARHIHAPILEREPLDVQLEVVI